MNKTILLPQLFYVALGIEVAVYSPLLLRKIYLKISTNLPWNRLMYHGSDDTIGGETIRFIAKRSMWRLVLWNFMSCILFIPMICFCILKLAASDSILNNGMNMLVFVVFMPILIVCWTYEFSFSFLVVTDRFLYLKTTFCLFRIVQIDLHRINKYIFIRRNILWIDAEGRRYSFPYLDNAKEFSSTVGKLIQK